MSVGRRSNAPILFQRRCPDRPPPAYTHALPWRPPSFCRPHRRIHRSCPRDALAPKSWLRSRSLIRSGCGIHERPNTHRAWRPGSPSPPSASAGILSHTYVEIGLARRTGVKRGAGRTPCTWSLRRRSLCQPSARSDRSFAGANMVCVRSQAEHRAATPGSDQAALGR